MRIRFWNRWLDEKKLHLFVLELQEGAKPVDILNGSKLAASPGFGGLFTEAGAQSLQAVWTPDGKSVVFAAVLKPNAIISAPNGAAPPVGAATGGGPPPVTLGRQRFSQTAFSP